MHYELQPIFLNPHFTPTVDKLLRELIRRTPEARRGFLSKPLLGALGLAAQFKSEQLISSFDKVAALNSSKKELLSTFAKVGPFL